MTRRVTRVSMRLWLALAFALAAAATALVAGETMTRRSEAEFERQAERSALLHATQAREAVVRGIRRGDHTQVARAVAERRDIAVFLIDRRGHPITPERSNQTSLASVPGRSAAVDAALAGRSVVRTFERGTRATAAVPLPGERAAVLLIFAAAPGYAAPMIVFESQLLIAVVLGLLVGAAIGTLVAATIASRLRRIAVAAEAIEGGRLDVPVPTRIGDEVGQLAVTFDRMRTRLHESVSTLRSEQARLRRLLERLDQGVVAVGPGLQVEMVNGAAGRLLGVQALAEGDPLPEPWPDFPLRHFALELHRSGASMQNVRVAPSEELSYTLVGIPAGDAFGTAVLVITDVSELERRERVEREFVANAAHELRTPVAAITAAIEVLQSGAKELPAERDRFLAILERQSARLARLGRALLVLARAQSNEAQPRLEPLELYPLLEDVADGLRLHEGVDVEVDCPAGLGVIAERDLVEQVLSNLAANASKHTQHGRITIAARSDASDRISIEVSDTGGGIPLDERGRIFDRFYRGGSRDSDGFGLGLAIVRQAVRVLGGTVEIVGGPGSGTTVRVTLPKARVEVA